MQHLSPDFLFKHGLRKVYNAQRSYVLDKVKSLTKGENIDNFSSRFRYIPSPSSKFSGKLENYCPSNVLAEKLKANYIFDIYYQNNKPSVDIGIDTLRLKTSEYNSLVQKYEKRRLKNAKIRKQKLKSQKAAFLKECRIEYGGFEDAFTQTGKLRVKNKETQQSVNTNEISTQSNTILKETSCQAEQVSAEISTQTDLEKAALMATELEKVPVCEEELTSDKLVFDSKESFSDASKDSWEEDEDLTTHASLEPLEKSSCSEIDMAEAVPSPEKCVDVKDKVRCMRFRLTSGDPSSTIKVKINGEKNAIHHSLSNRPEYNHLIVTSDERRSRKVLLKREEYHQDRKGRRKKKWVKEAPQFLEVDVEILGGKDDKTFETSNGNFCKLVLDQKMTRNFFGEQ